MIKFLQPFKTIRLFTKINIKNNNIYELIKIILIILIIK